MDLKRGAELVAPSLFTVGNMACGFYALLSAVRGEFTPAAIAIIAGMAFDALDGRVARLVHGESMFGVEFDSLTDFLTFGVAPAHMMYALVLKDYGAWGYPMAFLFALCGALRLARFNAVAHETGGSKTHFTGLPIPGGAGFLAAFVLVYQLIEEGRAARTWPWLMDQIPLLYGLSPLMVVVVAFLMVSTIPYPAFKQKGGLPGGAPVKIVGAALAGIVIFMYPQNSLFLIFWGYVLCGPALWVANVFRKPVPSGPPSDLP